MKIYKYILPNLNSTSTILLPMCAEILSTGLDSEGQLCMWALVNPEHIDKKVRTFINVGTGFSLCQPFDRVNLSYLGTITRGMLVHHIFERTL